jgi:hypothetical protein
MGGVAFDETEKVCLAFADFLNFAALALSVQASSKTSA